ncbi:MAG: choice-of-anchor I family protein [Planctomycetota bacterium]
MKTQSLWTTFLSFLLLFAVAQHATAERWTLRTIGGYRHGFLWDGGASEIVKYDPQTRRLFVCNGEHDSLDILDFHNPRNPWLIKRVSLKHYGSSSTHVAVKNGLVAVAMVGTPTTANGRVIFMNTDGCCLGVVTVGAMPDMLAFTPDGKKVLTANEGEPNDDFSIDPEGSVSIIDVPEDKCFCAGSLVTNVGFEQFNGDARPEGLRVSAPTATTAQDVEPEYLTISSDGKKAWVVLQENNALAIVDIDSAKVERIVPLGLKSFDDEESGLDASFADNRANIARWPVSAFYQPDGIASYQVGERDYLITANEGDSRSYGTYTDEATVATIQLDAATFANADELKLPENIGDLRVSAVDGVDANGVHKRLHVFGARSYSIWDASGKLQFDSGAEMEKLSAKLYPSQFNSDHSPATFDQRSDDKGPEPEGVAIGQIGDTSLAFIGIERFSGILVVDVSNPQAPVTQQLFKKYPPPLGQDVADQGPEGLIFIPAADSPNGKPLLVVAYEVSGTTRIYEVVKEM